MDITINEAIKVLTKERNDHHSFPTDIIGKAEQLGIEALKRVKWHKDQHQVGYYELLPGETEE